MIAGKAIHGSHALAWKQGVWLCTACGAFAQAAADTQPASKKLAKEVPSVRRRAGESKAIDVGRY